MGSSCLRRVILSILFLLAGLVPAYGANITISDGVYTGTGWYSNREDQEVEPGNMTGQSWDLEAFYLGGMNLTLVGGYDFVNGQWGGGRHYRSGDIFIDVTGDAVYGPSNTGSGSGNAIVNNTFGYDYVLAMDFASKTYNVYSLDPDTTLVAVYFGQNDESNPWRYASGGTAVPGWQGIGFSDLTGLPDSAYGLLGGSHNALTVDLGFLPSGTAFLSHFTIECGNDSIMGRGVAVPEPGTLLLLGSGLVCLAGFRRMTPTR